MAREIRRSMAHDPAKSSKTSKDPKRAASQGGASSTRSPDNAKKGRAAKPGSDPHDLQASPADKDALPETKTASAAKPEPAASTGIAPTPARPPALPPAASGGSAAPGPNEPAMPVSLAALAETRSPLSFLTSDAASKHGAPPASASGGQPPPLPGAGGPAKSVLPGPPVMPPLTSSGPSPVASASAPSKAANPPAKGPTPPGAQAAHLSSDPFSTVALALAATAPQPGNDAGDSDTYFEGDGAEPESTNADRRVARRRPAGPVRGKVAANDDAPSIGGLIYALEQQPSNRIYRHAAIASVVWAIAGLIFAVLSLSSEAALSSWSVILAKPTTFLTGAAIVVPIAVIWLLALLSWRAEELRLRSSTMTEVAIRLAEPDRMAEDAIASLGQAVRRQVSFMNEAVGRALGRAGELEALVHNEVAALERSYEENERRIRGLISELANERHALTSTSVSFNDTLRTLGREVPTLIEKLSNQQANLSHIIKGAGENLNQLESSLATSVKSLESELGGRTSELQGVLENYTGALGHALGQRTEQLGTMMGSHGQRLQAMIDDRAKRLETSLGGRTEAVQKMLEDYTAGLAQALGQRTAQMQSAFAEHMGALDSAIANRTENLQTVFEEYARALDSTLAARAGTLDKQLVERTRALDSAFEGRLQLFDQAIKDSTRAIDQAVDSRAKALTTALGEHARTFSETISRQSQDLDQSLNQGITAVRRTSENITRQSLKAIESLAGQSDMLKSVSENLVSQISSLTNRFEAQGHTILKAANALESVNYKIDSTLQSRHAELSETLERMAGKADEFTRHVRDYSTTIEGSLTEAEARALAAAEQLKIGTQTHRDQALSEIERLKVETDAESTRALEALKDRLSHVSSEVSTQLGSLTSRFSETTEDVRKRAERVADELAREQARMREEAERLPHTTRESAQAMRQALQDQLRAIDQLSSLAMRESERRDVSLPVAHGGALKPADATVGSRAAPAPARPAAGAGGGRNISSLSESLAHELGARGGQGAGSGQRPGSAGESDAHASWSLGDLLKRASDNEGRGGGARAEPPLPAGRASGAAAAQPPAPAPVPERVATAEPFKFDVDVLARALDGATAAVIWQRLRAGQRGIMVRSIYSAEGRQVFDEIARRYPDDANLNTTINRYIADFERILRDTDARDQSGRLAQSHMTSTMGRVYLLLAHASGRIS